MLVVRLLAHLMLSATPTVNAPNSVHIEPLLLLF
jgi:hypothetical protein